MMGCWLLMIVLAGSFFGVSTVMPNEKIIVTQEDENCIIELAANLQGFVESVTSPASSILPIEKYKNSNSYKSLLEYGSKLLPYLISEYQIEEESRVRVGSKLAERDLSDPEDLIRYQTERAEKIRSSQKMLFNWHILNLLLADIAINEKIWDKAPSIRDPQLFSWIEWWEKNKDNYDFKTKKPIKIDTTYKLHNHTHISTEKQDDFLYLEACNVPYNMIIERAAAEMGQKVFIGEHSYIYVIANVRMRGVTFEEFADLIGTTVSVSKFPYYWDGDVCHFGGEKEAKPRTIYDDWGIVLGNTIFHEGDKMPITIVARGMDTSDRLYPSFGSFKIMTNDGKIVQGYTIIRNDRSSVEVPDLKEHEIEITLDLSDFVSLPAGEYNIRFRYLKKETPILPIEIYPKSK